MRPFRSVTWCAHPFATLSVLALAPTSFAGCLLPAQEPPIALERVERSGFSMDMPSWDVEMDRDQGGSGRYVIVQGGLRSEVQWTTGGTTVEEMDAALLAIQSSDDGFELLDRREERTADEVRVDARLVLGGRIWIAMTQIAHPESGLYVSVSVSGRPREVVDSLQPRMLETLRGPSDPSRLSVAWPSSDLPDSFGVVPGGGSPVLVSRDGRLATVSELGPDTILAMVRDPERASGVFRGYAAGLDVSWGIEAGPVETRNLSGPAWQWRLLDAEGAPVVASLFTLDEGAGYVVFSAGSDVVTELEALGLRFGCPGEAGASVLERPSACQVGVEEYCDP